jgi:hypothetical protein
MMRRMIARMIRQKLQSVEFKPGVPSRNFGLGPIPLLPTPITLLGFMARTRIVVSPISKNATSDSAPTDWHAFHLRQISRWAAPVLYSSRRRRSRSESGTDILRTAGAILMGPATQRHLAPLR